MAKKKAAAKKASTKAKPAKKAAPAKKAPAKSAKPAKPSTSAVKNTATKSPAKSNGVVKGQVKPASKKAASSGSGKPAAFKAKNNGTADEKGLNPQTYQMLRQDIISTLWKYDEITFDELCAAMEKIHGKNFVGDSHKYLRQVVTDLMNIELIELVEHTPNRQAYRIRQRLGS